MNETIKKILTLACISLIILGIEMALLDLAIWLNRWWCYPLGLWLSILVVLGAFEIIERAER